MKLKDNKFQGRNIVSLNNDLFELMPVGLLETSQEGLILSINPSARQLLTICEVHNPLHESLNEIMGLKNEFEPIFTVDFGVKCLEIQMISKSYKNGRTLFMLSDISNNCNLARAVVELDWLIRYYRSDYIHWPKYSAEQLDQRLNRVSSQASKLQSYFAETRDLSYGIENYAKQAKILSLNVAVEAAKQGEDAKGFFKVFSDGIKEFSEHSNELSLNLLSSVNALESSMEDLTAVFDRNNSEQELPTTPKIKKENSALLLNALLRSPEMLTEERCLFRLTLISAKLKKAIRIKFGPEIDFKDSPGKDDGGFDAGYSLDNLIYDSVDLNNAWLKVFEPKNPDIFYSKVVCVGELYRLMESLDDNLNKWLHRYNIDEINLDSLVWKKKDSISFLMYQLLQTNIERLLSCLR